jgi:DNA uptake protein ComE-like DNA-binding protein
MPSAQNEIKELLQVVPEWTRFLSEPDSQVTIDSTIKISGRTSTSQLSSLFEKLGPKTMYNAASSLGEKRKTLIKLVRDHYILTLAATLLPKNATLRRYFQERRVDKETQHGHITSIAAELAFKLEEALTKRIIDGDQEGYKVLLPAYVQASLNNAVIDFVKLESQWEKQTLSDLNLDDDQEDPRDNIATETTRLPENIVLSKEKVKYLNEFRQALQELFARQGNADPSLTTVDCIFGLGLSSHSTPGVEMTMRECCEKLSIAGETQARKIARCQVLLDKGMDQVRQLVREKLPTIAEYRKQELNINNASRRDLRHQLDLTEGEVERLIVHRQYKSLSELVEKSVVKADRLQGLADKGAAAVPVPVDMNSATVRDLIDILALSKEKAQRLASLRPIINRASLVEKKVLSEDELNRLLANGAVLKPVLNQKTNINKAELSQFIQTGIEEKLAKRLLTGRPYSSWQELDEYLACEDTSWQLLRKNFILSESSSS